MILFNQEFLYFGMEFEIIHFRKKKYYFNYKIIMLNYYIIVKCGNFFKQKLI